MPIINVLERTFQIVFPISSVLMFKLKLSSQNTSEKGGDIIEEKENRKKKVENIINGFIRFSVVLLHFTALLILFIVFPKYLWILGVFSVPIYLEYFACAGMATRTLGAIIKSKNKSPLSSNERIAIETVAYVVWFFSIWNLDEKLQGYVMMFPNPIISDFLTLLLLVFFLFMYIFFIIALTSISLGYISELLNIGKNKYSIAKYFEYACDFFGNCAEKKMGVNTLLASTVNAMMRLKHPVKWSMIVLMPFAFATDLITQTFMGLFRWGCISIGYIAILFHLIISAIEAFFRWLLNLTDRYIVSFSFRLALILALVSIVILNRYQTIFKACQESTAILEFLASSIVIPVIFEWIYSIRNK